MNKRGQERVSERTPRKGSMQNTPRKMNVSKQFIFDDHIPSTTTLHNEKPSSFNLSNFLYPQLLDITKIQIEQYESIYKELEKKVQEKEKTIKTLKTSIDSKDHHINSLLMSLRHIQEKQENDPEYKELKETYFTYKQQYETFYKSTSPSYKIHIGPSIGINDSISSPIDSFITQRRSSNPSSIDTTDSLLNISSYNTLSPQYQRSSITNSIENSFRTPLKIDSMTLDTSQKNHLDPFHSNLIDHSYQSINDEKNMNLSLKTHCLSSYSFTPYKQHSRAYTDPISPLKPNRYPSNYYTDIPNNEPIFSQSIYNNNNTPYSSTPLYSKSQSLRDYNSPLQKINTTNQDYIRRTESDSSNTDNTISSMNLHLISDPLDSHSQPYIEKTVNDLQIYSSNTSNHIPTSPLTNKVPISLQHSKSMQSSIYSLADTNSYSQIPYSSTDPLGSIPTSSTVTTIETIRTEPKNSSISIYQSDLFYSDTIQNYNQKIICNGYGYNRELQDIHYTENSVTFYGNKLILEDSSILLIMSILGVGGYSIVFKCNMYTISDPSTPMIVALKMNKSTNDNNLSYYNHIKQEKERLKNLNNPYIIHYICDIPDYPNSITGYVMEYVNGISLTKYINQRSLERSRSGLTEQEILPILYQILLALNYLEKVNYAHLDLKPDNILITKDGKIKLIDFGSLSLARPNTGTLMSYVSSPYIDGYTLQYASNEVLNNSPTQRSDIFSLGATLYHMITGKPPREYIQNPEFNLFSLYMRTENDILLPDIYIQSLSKDLISIYNKCLEPKFDQRPHASELLQESLFKSLNRV